MKYTAKMVDSKLFNTWAIHNGWLRYEDTDNGTIRIQIWVVPFGYTVRVNYKDDKIISIQ